MKTYNIGYILRGAFKDAVVSYMENYNKVFFNVNKYDFYS